MPLAPKRKPLDSQPPELQVFPRFNSLKIKSGLVSYHFVSFSFYSLFSFHLQLISFSLLMICSPFSLPSHSYLLKWTQC